MSSADIDTNFFRSLLLQRRQDARDLLKSNEDATRPPELDQTRVGRLSRMDAMQSHAMAKESERRGRFEVSRIVAALERIDKGEYGNCLNCGESISVKRLEFDPAASQCIHCAAKSEDAALS
jgi:DnaK suppressor protein